MRVIGSKCAVLLALVVAMLIALPSSAIAATAIMVGGLGQTTLNDTTMSMALNGTFTGIDPVSETPWQRINVSWPADAAPIWGTRSLADSVAVGTANLIAAIKTTYSTTPGPITVLGTSAGSLVVDEAMRVLANDPTAPPKSAINFVVLGDATQKLAGTNSNPIWNPFDTLSGYTYGPPPVTPYNLKVVNYEYDGFADFPDRWWNLYAVVNAVAGGLLLHAATWFVDLPTADAGMTETKNSMDGLTTTYLVHPETLPLVQLFPQLAPIQDWLKQQIDAGYSRNDQTAGSSSLASQATASLTTASLPTAYAEIAPNQQSSASTIDPLAGAAANSVEERAQSQQELANATAPPIDETPTPVDGTEELANATAPPISEIATPVKGTQGTANATIGVAQATPQADVQLAKAARATGNETIDPTDRKNVKASMNGGTGGTGGHDGGPGSPGSLGTTRVDGHGGTGGHGDGAGGHGDGPGGHGEGPDSLGTTRVDGHGGTGGHGRGPTGDGLTDGNGGAGIGTGTVGGGPDGPAAT
ncbi:MAG TPA: PE-PPE domain-containing protein [Mycobacterium sp.]|nr:PE-PPE domain-containing protein [Mycobacterium sp.]